MKKEIIFRGKSMCDVGFIYGDLIHKRNGLIMIQDENGLGTDVDEETIGQFTGLRDKNGIDIYEGDIVFYSYLDGYCNMQKTKSIVRVECQDFVVSLLKDYNPSISNISDIEVIGNIYDNKELINK